MVRPAGPINAQVPAPHVAAVTAVCAARLIEHYCCCWLSRCPPAAAAVLPPGNSGCLAAALATTGIACNTKASLLEVDQ